MCERRPETMPPWERPLRIPGNVPLEHTTPPFAFAGQRSSWEVPLRLAQDLPPGTELRLQLSGGRNNKGVLPEAQVDQPGGAGFVTLRTSSGSRRDLLPGPHPGTFRVLLPDQPLRAGELLVATLGDRSGGGSGIQAPSGRLLNKFFLLHTDEPGRRNRGTWGPDDQHRIVAACTLHVLGEDVAQLRAYGPSQVEPDTPFRLLIRPEDSFSNLSHQTLSRVSVWLDGRPRAAPRRPVPGSTCVVVQVSLPAPGVYRLQVRDDERGLETTTNPLLCRRPSAGEPRVFWGMIHGHTEISDGTGTLEYYFHQAQREAGLDFAAPGDHDHLHETSAEMWEQTCATVARWHQPGVFVTFPGYEWAKWRRNGDGDRNVYYRRDHPPLYRSDEGKPW